MSESSVLAAGDTRQAARHVVDALIEERAERLMASPFWPAVRAAVYPLLNYAKAVELADRVARMGGREVMDYSRDFLGMGVIATGARNVPETGPCVLVVNHPGGISDGVAVWQVLAARRPDLCFFANRDALRVASGLSDVVIPVEWRVTERSRAKTRETLRAAVEAFRAARCVVVFPAGRMAKWRWGERRLVEFPWADTAIGWARKFDAPVIPVGLKSRMSWLYYGFDTISDELRNMTLFHELLAKRGATYRMNVGAPIAAGDLPQGDADATEFLKSKAVALAWGEAGHDAGSGQ